MIDIKPVRPEGWGPWRKSYMAASNDAARLCKQRVMNYLVVSELDAGDVRWWTAAQLPKKRTKSAR